MSQGPRLKLSNYLGALRDDPHDASTLDGLAELARTRDQARLGEDPVRLLELARQTHEARGEAAAVARLIEVEAQLVVDDQDFEASLWKELGRVRSEQLLDPEGAQAAYEHARELRADDMEVDEALKRLKQAESNWGKTVKRFVEEAEATEDVTLKCSLLLRAACLNWQYRKRDREKETDQLFERVLELDPGNRDAVHLYEHVLRAREAWEQLVEHLRTAAGRVVDVGDRIACWLHVGLVLARQLERSGEAVHAFREALALDPRQPEAMAFLSEHFTANEQWSDLLSVYEGALSVPQKIEVEAATLLQIGMVHWRMRHKPEDAEPYFARLRKLDAAHRAMLDFYRESFAQRGENEELLVLLSDAQRAASEPERKLELALELARTAEAQPGSAERAIDAWRLVQRLDPDNERATTVLRRLYAQAEKWNALVEVIKSQIDATSDDDANRKVELLRELLMVYRDRLQMDGMVINTLNAIVRLKPDDRAALDELGAKYEAMGRWNELIHVLTVEADAQTDMARKVEGLLRVAALWIEHFTNYNQATAPLEKVIEIDPDNRQALVQLKDIYQRKRAWKSLFEVLRKEKSVASDPSVRLSNTIEMARLAADRLHRHADAIALWQEALADDPNNQEGLEAVARMAEREGQWPALVDILERELAHAADDEARVRLLQKLGAIHQEHLNDAEQARHAWKRVLAIDPRHTRALRALRESLVAAQQWDEIESLYEELGDWEGFADVLASEAERTADTAVRVELSLRAARVYENRLQSPERAQRSYERVIAVDPGHVGAAEALATMYERDEKWPRLKAMLDIVLAGLPADATEERIALLARLGGLCRDRLRDGEAAFAYAAKAFGEAPTSSDVREALEAAAVAAAAYDRLVALYVARADEADADEALSLRRRVAELASDRLGQDDLAAKQYEKVLAAHSGDEAALAALERIYRAASNTDALRRILADRLEHESDVDARLATLDELAALEEPADPEAAANRYRAMLEIDPTNRETLAALDRLVAAAEQWEELAEVLARRIELEDETQARIELGGRLGLLRLDHLGDPQGALDVFGEVIGADPEHAASISALERMVERETELAPEITRLLERVYEQAGRYDKLANVLQRRLTLVDDAAEVQRLRLKLAEIAGSKLGDAAGAYGSIEEAFLNDPSNSSLWDQLADAAERAGQQRGLAHAYSMAIEAGDLGDADVAELAGRVARIYEEVLGQPEEAEPFHRRVLAHDPLADTAFEALKELYTATERWDDLQALYRARIQECVDGEQKLDLLLQLCFLFEEILNRPDPAIETYEQVLELQPDHAAARRTLERLYQANERWRPLATLLRGNLDQAEDRDRIELLQRLGELYETKLGDPVVAVDQYEAVLLDRPSNLRAQQALARLLGVDSLRQRIAAILEPLYESQGAWTDLANVLEIRLDSAETSAGRAEMLMRIGELHEQRTRSPEGAFSAYSRAVEADPADSMAREALARLASEREAFRRQRAQVLERAADATTDERDARAEILLELAVLFDEHLADHDAAERTYDRLLAAAPDNPDTVLRAARALERIHLGREDYVRLVGDLERQVDVEPDADARGDLLVRIAETYENMLERPEGAIGAHRQRLEIDPGNADVWRALVRLYERTAQWDGLVEALRGLADASTDDEERRALGRRVGTVFEEKLEDLDRAVEAYNDVLTAFGPDGQTLAALGSLYERTGNWDELLRTLEQEESVAESDEDRAQTRLRMAEVMRLHTGDGERAIEHYDLVLQHDGAHRGALAALDALMQSEEPALRIAAARVAEPRYEAAQAWDKRIATLEVLAQTDDPIDRLAALRRAADVAERGLGDPGVANGYLARALRAAVDDLALPQVLADVLRLTEATSSWSSCVALLREVAPSIGDALAQAEVHRRIGRMARDRLQDGDVAGEYFTKVLEEKPDDREALDALEQLHEQAGDRAALVDILRRKLDLTTDTNERRALLMREAEIHERGLDDPDAAISVLSELLVEGPDVAAYQALERLYTVKERWDDLAASYEEQLDRGVGSAVELRYKLARLHHHQLSDTLRALDFLRDAVTDDLGHEPSIALLESILATSGEARALAGEILEPGYLARMEWPKLVNAIEARIDGEQDVEERKRLLLRLSQIHEDQLENFAAAFDAHTRLFREDPRDRDEWDTLGRLARMGERWRPLAEILSEPLADGANDPDLAALAMLAGGVWDARCEEPSKAAGLFAKALAFDPNDERAFKALESTYRRSEAWDELLPLYREQADAAETDERRISLLKRRAEVLQEHKSDALAAREAYHEILDVDPDDAIALEMYERLLSDAEEWDVLAEHLRERIERAMDASSAVDLRIRLAQLHEQKRGDVSAAIDVYEEVTQSDPREKRAIGELERLVQGDEHRLRITLILEPIYRDLDQWKKLIAVDEAQVKLVDDDVERVRLLGEIGTLHEQRGGDEALALDAWSRAFVLDPANEDARAHVDRLAVRQNAWDSLVEAYEAACKRTDDAVVMGSLLGTIAGVHDARRGDPRAAIAAYERLAEHDPQDPTPLESLESLHTMVGDWAGLASVLERKVMLAFDIDERGELLRRIGSIHEGFLGDRVSAIDAYQRAVAESDTDEEAYEALDRLYATDRNLEALRDVIVRRVELVTDPAARVELGLRLGELCEKQLRQADAAVSAYQRVLEDDPANARALTALGGLYEQAANWPELLDNLQQLAAIATDDAERVALRHRSGEVLEREVVDIDAAIDAYRDALDGDPRHAKSIDALMRITRNPDHRARAIEIVEPLLRSQERWDDVVQIIEQGLDQITDSYERRMELQRIAEVHEHGRQSPRGAFEALRRGLAEDPGDEEVWAGLERLAGVLDAWGELADVLAQEADNAADPAHASALFRNLAIIAEQRLGDEARAIAAYVRASEQDDDATETLGDLDRLYQKAERWESLVDVLERRVAATSDPLVRADLLVRLGGVRVEHLDDARGAFVAYREVLEGDPSDARALAGMERLGEHDVLALEVLEILENCYREIGALDKVAGLYDIRVRLAETATERIRLLEEVASIWENDLNDLSRALKARRRAFELDPRATEVLDELERLAERAGSWEGLRGLAEELAASGALDERSKRELYERAAGWYRDRLGDAEAEERCLREVLAITPELLELHERLAALLSAPGRERELVAAWRAWAEVEPDPDSKRERLREAARVSEQALGDAAAAAESYAALLEVDEDDVDALEQLARLHQAEGRHAEAAELLSRWLSFASDPVQRTELRHRLAAMQAAQLGDSSAAIATYQALLDDAPDDVEAADAIEGLLAAAERWDELRARLQARVDRAGSASERSPYRVALARLAEQQFGDAAGAIEELTAILQEEPGHPSASAELERLYLASERWRELADLLDERARAAAQAGDVAAEANMRRRAAKLAEEHLHDDAAAIASLERAHELAPDDPETLRWLVRLVEGSGDWERLTRHLSALLNLVSGDEAVTTAHRLAEIADDKLGSLDTAEAALQRALASGAGGETRERLKTLYEKHEAFDRLVGVLADEEAQASEPADKVALLTRMAELSRDRLGDPGTAAAHLERAVALVPDDRDALLGLCDLYIAAGRQADAIPVLEKIIGSYGGRRAKEVAVYQHRLGQAHEGMGNLDAAFEHYDAAFKIDLTNAKVLSDLGRLSLARGDLDRAQKSYRALLLQKLGAEVGIEKADVYFHLGQVSFEQGDKVKAKAMLERAIAEAGEHEAARNLLETF